MLCFLIPCLQLLFEVGILDLSAVSVTTGILSVAAVLPGATLISLLFRLHKMELMKTGVQHAKGRKTSSVLKRTEFLLLLKMSPVFSTVRFHALHICQVIGLLDEHYIHKQMYTCF